MDTTKHIQLLAKLNLALLMIHLFATFYLESYLPIELQNYLSLETKSEFTLIEGLILFTMFLLVIVHLASLIGLILAKLWAPKYFIYSLLGLFAYAFFLGPYVDHAIAATINELSILVMGAILAMLYTTNSAFNKVIEQNDVKHKNE